MKITERIREVLLAEDRALEANDMVTYEALVREETRLMDILRAEAGWGARR